MRLTVQQQRRERRTRPVAAVVLALSLTSWACSEERVVQTIELRKGAEAPGHTPECTGDTCSETASESTEAPGPEAALDAGVRNSGVATAGTGAKGLAGKGALGAAGAKPVQPMAAGASAVARDEPKPG
ncbi:MAG TPA: hypothetical protein VMF89_16465, partial [Polyangiales bacterium]|nr:hypothetical protein [Polyangiales bacterium]